MLSAMEISFGDEATLDIHSQIGSDLVALIPKLRVFARYLCHNYTQADDQTQDALASAWRGRASYTPGTNLKAWLFMILRNRYYSEGRRAWRQVQLDPELAENTLVANCDPGAPIELDELRRAMLALPDVQRQALTLVAVAGLSYQAAATLCGCKIGTVKSRVNRARQALPEILARGGLISDGQAPGDAMQSMIADGRRLSTRAPQTRPARAPCSARGELGSQLAA